MDFIDALNDQQKLKILFVNWDYLNDKDLEQVKSRSEWEIQKRKDSFWSHVVQNVNEIINLRENISSHKHKPKF